MEQTSSVLNGYYKNVSVGIDATESVLSKTKNESLNHELNKQLDYYKEQKTALSQEMLRMGITPESKGTMAKLCTEMNVAFHSIGGIEDREIAKLMVQGTNMGIVQMTELMNRHQDIPSDIKRLGKEMIRREEAYIERLKPYL